MPLHRSVFATMLCGAGLVALGACHPAKLGQGRNTDDRPVTVGGRLDCPQTQGDLTRIDAAADGRSCRYTDNQGREARLMLLDLAGKSAKDALAGTETELKALVPAAVSTTPPPPPPQTGAAVNLSDDDKDDDKDDGGSHDHTRIDLPGIHIDADGKDGAQIRAFGQTIDAHGKDAVIHGGWNGHEAVVNAHDGGVEVRAGWFGEHSVDANYLLGSQTAGPSGVHTAGYIAKGPATGPLVVGIETSKVDDDHSVHEEHYRDLRRLVDLNVHR